METVEDRKIEEEFELSLRAINEASANQSSYWNFLSIVSFGFLSTEVFANVEPIALSILYFFFWLSNFLAVSAFQEEICTNAKHLNNMLEKHQSKISQSHALVFNSKRVVEKKLVDGFHVLVLIVVLVLLNTSWLSATAT